MFCLRGTFISFRFVVSPKHEWCVTFKTSEVTNQVGEERASSDSRDFFTLDVRELGRIPLDVRVQERGVEE